MKKLQILFLAAMFVFSSTINEVQSQDIEDIAFFQSQKLRTQLGLSFNQTQKLEESLRYFGEAYKRLLAAEFDENQSFKSVGILRKRGSPVMIDKRSS